MNEILKIITISVIAVSLIVLVSHIAIYLKVNSKKKCTDTCCKKHDTLLSNLDRLIKANVIATNQTVVDQMKSSNIFMQLDREEAFEKTKCNIIKTIDKNQLTLLQSCMGNLDEWINSRIEYHVGREAEGNG